MKLSCSVWNIILLKEGVHVRIKQRNCESCQNEFASKSKHKTKLKLFFWKEKDFPTDWVHEGIKSLNHESLHPTQS